MYKIIGKNIINFKINFNGLNYHFKNLSSQSVVVENRNQHIRLIGLNRPEKRNAINKATATKLKIAFEDFDSDPETRVAILHGFGGSFCAGYDLEELSNFSNENENINTLINQAPLVKLMEISMDFISFLNFSGALLDEFIKACDSSN